MAVDGQPPFPTEGLTLTFVLTGDRATLGRVHDGTSSDVDLALTGAAADPGVSHHQCEFALSGTSWTVTDSDSANGTWINDADDPLAAGAVHTLVDGDRVLIGAWTALTVQVAPPAPT
jgi:predicted component of type VI protein secretion system